MMFKAKTFLKILIIFELCIENTKSSSNKNNQNTTNFKIYLNLTSDKRANISIVLNAEVARRNLINQTGDTSAPPSPPPPSSSWLNENDSNPCPDEFTFSSEYQYCYILTSPQTFPPKCPYSTFIFPTPDFITWERLESVKIWAMIRRNTTDDLGPFEPTTGSSYGLPVYNYSYSSQHASVLENNCLVTINNMLLASSCNDQYPALCIYYYDSLATNNYCQKHYQQSNNYTYCIADGINMEKHSCYCTRENISNQQQNGQTTRDQFCSSLAEPLSKYQNQLLVNQLRPRNDICWFGLYRDTNGLVKWNISDTVPNYTNATNIIPSKPFGAVQFTDPAGWIFADDDGAIQCGVCELKNAYDKQVYLRLKYIPSDNELELKIENPYELSNTFEDEYSIFCFVGPVEDDFKETALLDEVRFEGTVNTNPDPIFQRFEMKEDVPVYYWCDGFQQPDLRRVQSNKVLVYDRHNIHEYAIQARIQTDNDPYLNKQYITIRNRIIELLEFPLTKILRIMKILKYDQSNAYMDVVLHVTTDWKYQNETAIYHGLLKAFEDLVDKEGSPVLSIRGFGQCDFCLSETTSSSNRSLHWPKTAIGAIALPTEMCIQENGEPVMRKCEGDFLQGGFWSDAIGVCSDENYFTEKTWELIYLLNEENVTADDLSQNLAHITEDNNVSVLDIYLISEILIKLDKIEDDVNITDVVTIINNIMNFDEAELDSSQVMLNCTDEILYSLDKILIKTKFEENLIISSPKLLLQISDVKATNIIGIALQGNSENDDFDGFTLKPIYNNDSLGEIFLENDIQLAAFLPKNLLLEIELCTPPEIAIKLIIVLFYNDVLFNENVDQIRQTNSRIISIIIPDFNCSFNTPIPVIFRPLYELDLEKGCAYWNYGIDNFEGKNSHGSWSVEHAIPQEIVISNAYEICSFDHVTHFALLMMNGSTKEKISDKNIEILDVITAIGATLSVSCILAMFVIAAVLRNWRQSSSSKIILNLALVIGLQIILFYTASNVGKEGIWCTVTGASLHYTILSQFCWMLVIAILQFRRFVTVFYNEIPHFLLIAYTFCWCFPLVPVTVLLTVSNQSYSNSVGLCYPSNQYFYFGVILPISVILIINLIIFIRIVHAVCRKKIKAYGPKGSSTKLEVSLAIFLFFLLGISWVFGLVLGFGQTAFAYLFCLTAAFQGVAVFLFFIHMNGKSKMLWFQLKRGLFRDKLNQENVRSKFYSFDTTETTNST